MLQKFNERPSDRGERKNGLCRCGLIDALFSFHVLVWLIFSFLKFIIANSGGSFASVMRVKIYAILFPPCLSIPRKATGER